MRTNTILTDAKQVIFKQDQDAYPDQDSIIPPDHSDDNQKEVYSIHSSI